MNQDKNEIEASEVLTTKQALELFKAELEKHNVDLNVKLTNVLADNIRRTKRVRKDLSRATKYPLLPYVQRENKQVTYRRADLVNFVELVVTKFKKRHGYE
jgi:hypothetical protein